MQKQKLTNSILNRDIEIQTIYYMIPSIMKRAVLSSDTSTEALHATTSRIRGTLTLFGIDKERFRNKEVLHYGKSNIVMEYNEELNSVNINFNPNWLNCFNLLFKSKEKYLTENGEMNYEIINKLAEVYTDWIESVPEPIIIPSKEMSEKQNFFLNKLNKYIKLMDDYYEENKNSLNYNNNFIELFKIVSSVNPLINPNIKEDINIENFGDKIENAVAKLFLLSHYIVKNPILIIYNNEILDEELVDSKTISKLTKELSFHGVSLLFK